MLVFVAFSGTAVAADKPLHQMDNKTIDARIRAAFSDPDPFAAAKIVGQMFADELTVGPRKIAREAILDVLVKESARFREEMPNFRFEERGLFVADNGVVMSGRMIGTRANGKNMDTAFVTILARDGTGRIVSQSTLEVPRNPPAEHQLK